MSLILSYLGTIHPRHIVQATGLNGEPQIPSLPGMNDFKGRIVHTTQFTNADPSYKGKKVVVVGAGSSGHDIALTCHGKGAEVTMIQRSPMFIVSLKSAHIGLRKRWNEQTVSPHHPRQRCICRPRLLNEMSKIHKIAY
jgi:cation diffusion facilitator CzcD-associated flavoprotein CzcO